MATCQGFITTTEFFTVLQPQDNQALGMGRVHQTGGGSHRWPWDRRAACDGAAGDFLQCRLFSTEGGNLWSIQPSMRTETQWRLRLSLRARKHLGMLSEETADRGSGRGVWQGVAAPGQQGVGMKRVCCELAEGRIAGYGTDVLRVMVLQGTAFSCNVVCSPQSVATCGTSTCAWCHGEAFGNLLCNGDGEHDPRSAWRHGGHLEGNEGARGVEWHDITPLLCNGRFRATELGRAACGGFAGGGAFLQSCLLLTECGNLWYITHLHGVTVWQPAEQWRWRE
jgi:hypothetical protein